MIDAIVSAFSGPGAGFMYAITAVLALSLAISIERSWLYWLTWHVNSDAILSALRADDMEAAQTAAAAHPGAHLLAAGAAAAQAGAESGARSDAVTDAAWDAMGAEAALVENALRRRVAWLATAGNIATMLGLLGTIYGLIFAFQGLADASTVQRGVRISDGIATAMTTTAWGLLVGIPSLALHTLLDSKASRELAWCEAAAGLLVGALRRQRNS